MDIQEFGAKIVSIFDESSFSRTKKKLSAFESLSKKFESLQVGFSTTRDTDKVFKSMQDALDQIKKQMDAIKRNPDLYSGKPSEQKALIKELENLEKVYDRIKKIQKGGNNPLFRIGEYAGKTQGIIDKLKGSFNAKGFAETFKEITKSTIKWGLALLGARSTWMLLRRSMSVYLSQNEELYNKLQACYYALGSLFAPILEWFLNLLVKIVGYINIFVKALGFAGIQMKGIAKSSASVAKMLAPFDEINNIGDSSGGGSSGGNPLSDFSPNAAWAQAIERFAALMKEKWQEILALVIGLWAALKLIANFGMDALTAGGWGLFISSVLLFFQDTWKFVSDPTWENFLKVMLDLGVAVLAFAVALGFIPGIWGALAIALGAAILFFRDEISSFIVWISGYIGDIINLLGQIIANGFSVYLGLGRGLFAGLSSIVKGGIDGIITLFKGLVDGGSQIIKGFMQILSGDFSNGFRNVFEGIVKIGKSVLNAGIDIVNGFLSAISRAINHVIDGINGIGFTVPDWIPSWLGGGKSWHPNLGHIANWGNIPHLEVGTNYVPNDMIAQLHQGEAVVPKAFNENQYNNSEETNELLRELIDVTRSKEFRAYISQREIGKNAVDYIKQQERITGGSVL